MTRTEDKRAELLKKIKEDKALCGICLEVKENVLKEGIDYFYWGNFQVCSQVEEWMNLYWDIEEARGKN